MDTLARADKRVETGMRHIARQHQIIHALEKSGHDASRARAILRQFEELLESHVTARDQLRRRLDDSNWPLAG
jgi:spore coat polysaccharide biosynthesis predicted glycosyltransferase SpsG